MRAQIHVNQHHIKFNRKTPKKRKKVLTVKTYKSNEYTDEVEIRGPSKVVYKPYRPLSCGATVWIECEYGDVHLPEMENQQWQETANTKGAGKKPLNADQEVCAVSTRTAS